MNTATPYPPTEIQSREATIYRCPICGFESPDQDKVQRCYDKGPTYVPAIGTIGFIVRGDYVPNGGEWRTWLAQVRIVATTLKKHALLCQIEVVPWTEETYYRMSKLTLYPEDLLDDDDYIVPIKDIFFNRAEAIRSMRP